ncbi:unnamed protein product [Coffea canephora]|uniref:Hexosyltransferase n=1 Tax=Coffea canephora TaxID=49390 RepID=A0A068V418_COFCA|nr:unnamed protein product [Coffea canephora]
MYLYLLFSYLFLTIKILGHFFFFFPIDLLFTNMATYAVMDCFCEMCLEPCADKVKWPKRLGPEPKYYFNAGVFVFEPSFPTYALEVTPPTAFAEQDLLNMFSKDRFASPFLHCMCNFFMLMWWRRPERINLNDVKVLHYCAADLVKPLEIHQGRDRRLVKTRRC